MLVWDDTLGRHDIRVQGAAKAQLSKYIDGGQLPNKNVAVEQAETVVTNFLDNALAGTDYHVRIHIESFPKKTEEGSPFVYTLWIGPLGEEPRPNWWDKEV